MKYSCNWEHTVLQKMEENREFQHLVSKAVSLPVDILIFASRKGYTGFWLVNTLKLLMLVGTASAPHFKSNYVLGEWVKMYKPKFRHQALKIMDDCNIDSFHILCSLCIYRHVLIKHTLQIPHWPLLLSDSLAKQIPLVGIFPGFSSSFWIPALSLSLLIEETSCYWKRLRLFFIYWFWGLLTKGR